MTKNPDGKEGKRMLVIGSSGAGKTYFTLKTLNTIIDKIKGSKKTTYFIIFSPTAQLQKGYRDISKRVKTIFFTNFTERSESKLKSIVEKHLKKKKKDNLFIILDDMGFNTSIKMRKDNYIDYLFMAARQLNVNVISLNQRLVDSSMLSRTNADYVVLFETRSMSELRMAREFFLEDMKKSEISSLWRKVYKKKYDYLFIDRSGPYRIYKRNGEEIIDVFNL